jgi:hypothetical protein
MDSSIFENDEHTLMIKVLMVNFKRLQILKVTLLLERQQNNENIESLKNKFI